VLCLNAGSSSLKAAGYEVRAGESEPVRVASAQAERVADHVAALDDVARALERADFAPDVLAHRIVHGGRHIVDHVVIDPDVRAQLDAAVPFAPLHLPVELAVLDAADARFGGRTPVACVDTAFHRHLLPAARRLPIPEELDNAGVRRYGFHGLSYEYLVHRLGADLGSRAVLAHLGNGSSLAAVRDGVGVDTTMGFTPAGGLVMGTRPGDLDPGVLLYMLRARDLDADGLEEVVDHRSGLVGLSGGASDVRDILAARDRGDARATLALDVYETVAAKHLAALTTVLGGLDTVVFTAGIGEHASAIRAGIAARLAHLGVAIDDRANEADTAVISPPNARVTVRVEPTDEALMMAVHAARLVAPDGSDIRTAGA
jgi:acetate kinase